MIVNMHINETKKQKKGARIRLETSLSRTVSLNNSSISIDIDS